MTRLDLDLDLVVDVDRLVPGEFNRHHTYRIALHLYMTTSKPASKSTSRSKSKST